MIFFVFIWTCISFFISYWVVSPNGYALLGDLRDCNETFDYVFIGFIWFVIGFLLTMGTPLTLLVFTGIYYVGVLLSR